MWVYRHVEDKQEFQVGYRTSEGWYVAKTFANERQAMVLVHFLNGGTGRRAAKLMENWGIDQ